MIHVVVALAAEARPLIAHFQLGRAEGFADFPIHRRAGMALIVAGVGWESTANAVEALAKATADEEPSAWLNVGVAGHRQHDLGTVVLARRVIDQETGAAYDLSPPEDLQMEMGEVRTVAHVETRYETDALYEMEAAAFCDRVTDLTSADLIQVLKIVSDNRRSGSLCVSARQVQGLVEESLSKVDLLVSCLHRKARRLSQ